MNKTQKIILAIFIPIIILFIVLLIANSVGVSWGGGGWIDLYGDGNKTLISGHKIYNPFYWEKTWYVWMLYVIFCCIFEYKLFSDKKDK